MKKTVFIVLALLLGMSLKAQQVKDFYSFDIKKINHIEQRTHLLYLLNNDERFVVSTSDQDGVFTIRRSKDSYTFNLADTFNAFYAEEHAIFCGMTKDEIGQSFSEWKSSLPDDFVASLMMDQYRKNRDNDLCANAFPFCTDAGLYEFPAGVNAGSGEAGPDYDCLYTTPNPAWYYMRMAQPGDMTIHMYSTPSYDIDFCCWGPFSDPVSPCPDGLTGAKK